MLAKNGKGHFKILSSIKAMRKQIKCIRINVFRALEINKKLMTILEMFIQEKQLYLD